MGDADFTVERMIARADDELANGLGNLVNRVVAMIGKYRDGRVPGPQPVAAGGEDLAAAIRHADGRIAAALEDFDFRQAAAAVWAIADEANRFINRVRPWELAKAELANAAWPTRAQRGNWTPCCVRCSRRARRSAGSWRRSCLTRRRASPLSARPATTVGFPPPPRCSGGWHRELGAVGARGGQRAGRSVSGGGRAPRR